MGGVYVPAHNLYFPFLNMLHIMSSFLNCGGADTSHVLRERQPNLDRPFHRKTLYRRWATSLESVTCICSSPLGAKRRSSNKGMPLPSKIGTRSIRNSSTKPASRSC